MAITCICALVYSLYVLFVLITVCYSEVAVFVLVNVHFVMLLLLLSFVLGYHIRFIFVIIAVDSVGAHRVLAAVW